MPNLSHEDLSRLETQPPGQTFLCSIIHGNSFKWCFWAPFWMSSMPARCNWQNEVNCKQTADQNQYLTLFSWSKGVRTLAAAAPILLEKFSIQRYLSTRHQSFQCNYYGLELWQLSSPLCIIQSVDRNTLGNIFLCIWIWNHFQL